MDVPLRDRPRAGTPAAHDPRWHLLVTRRTPADASYVYGVRTTGVYCRPDSPSRLPRPENVEFFDSAAQAESAGYRPSRRAHADRSALAARHAAIVAQACRAIEAAHTPPALGALAARAGLSRWHFHRLFRSLTGVTPRAYALALRTRALRERLAHGAPITDAIYAAGFGSNSRVYEACGAMLGMRPAQFRAGAPELPIRFAVGQCSLGAILVAQSPRGICAILIGDDPDALVRELQDQFPKADLVGGDAAFEHLVASVVGFVEAPGLGLGLPLDVRGTAFQQRVWQALREIPSGQTISYGELARRLGMPSAARAVAQACAANRIAVAIPCHRVVRGDGSVTGYRWGVARKRELLRREAAAR